ncbi:unnamed protein product [Cuscuta epithymum]|uniref:Uncharacterized protein n=1 Tax=Cuscuta epithymum TaxID=186058 RepID=A0AAV0GIV7_9ASTE|nr:unnamed protein product [Cuscuta epithymum]
MGWQKIRKMLSVHIFSVHYIKAPQFIFTLFFSLIYPLPESHPNPFLSLSRPLSRIPTTLLPFLLPNFFSSSLFLVCPLFPLLSSNRVAMYKNVMKYSLYDVQFFSKVLLMSHLSRPTSCNAFAGNDDS